MAVLLAATGVGSAAVTAFFVGLVYVGFVALLQLVLTLTRPKGKGVME